MHGPMLREIYTTIIIQTDTTFIHKSYNYIRNARSDNNILIHGNGGGDGGT